MEFVDRIKFMKEKFDWDAELQARLGELEQKIKLAV